jgi:exonuclease SbcC
VKIKKLSTIGTKGSDLDMDITGRDVLVGPNGSGKTTVIDAVCAGVLGYIPSIGKKPSNTMKLSSGSEMTISMSTDELTWQRTFIESRKRVKGDVKYTYSERVHANPELESIKERDKASELSSKLGNFPVMFDMSQFVKLSDTERRDFLFKICGDIIPEWDSEKIRTELFSTLTNDDGVYNEISVNRILDDVMSAYKESNDTYDNIDSIFKKVTLMTQVARSLKLKRGSAKEQLIRDKNDIGEESPYTVREINLEKDVLFQRKSSLNSEITSASNDAAKLSKIQGREIELKKLLVDCPKKSEGALKDDMKEISDDGKRLRELEKLKNDDIDKSNSNIISLNSKKSSKEHEITTIKSRISSIEKSNGTCPLMDSVPCPKVDDLNSYKLKCESDVEKLSLELESINSDIKIESDKKKTLIKDRLDINLSIEKKSDAYVEIKEELNKVRMSLAYTEEMRTIQYQINNSKTSFDIEAADKEIQSIDSQISEKNKLIDRLTKIESLKMSFERAKIDFLEAEEEYDILDHLSLLTGPKGLQGEFVRAIETPLRDKANEVLKRVNPDYEVYLQFQDKNKNEVFSFGLKRTDGTMVDFDVLGGAEKVMLGTCLMIGLISIKDPKIKILTIEAAEIDSSNLKLFMESLNQFAGEIDNIIISTCHDVSSVDGWSIHDVSKEEVIAEV